MSFFEEKIAGTNYEKSHLSWKKNYLAGGEFNTKSYVGNTPRNDHFLIRDDRFLTCPGAAPERYGTKMELNVFNFTLFFARVSPFFSRFPVSNSTCSY